VCAVGPLATRGGELDLADLARLRWTGRRWLARSASAARAGAWLAARQLAQHALRVRLAQGVDGVKRGSQAREPQPRAFEREPADQRTAAGS
jgi:hypothetical protein